VSVPRLEVRLDLVGHNTAAMVRRLGARGIAVTAVTKALLGAAPLARVFVAAGVAGLGDSRVANVATLRDAGVAAPVTMVRTPMLSQVERVVQLCDTSCNTEPRVLAALSAAARAQGRRHGVVLMVELGDLREGIMPDDLVAIARATSGLPNLLLRGIGANLACRSGVVPDAANMAELSGLAALVEHATDAPLEVVSGGNSANLGWALGPGVTGRINDLRLGEALLLGLDPVERQPVEGLHTDAFRLVAEVIESGTKPSMPWGTMAQTAFGEREHLGQVEQGKVVQTILALGRQDTDTTDLVAPPGMTIVGSSSDHLVTWTDERVAPGTEVAFAPGYAAVLRSMTSPTVETVYVNEAAEPPVPALK
jgi:predicted amino acid racemase